jgi:ABC-2 type transport system permease protein/lipopolysaccharide transport system permease protein
MSHINSTVQRSPLAEVLAGAMLWRVWIRFGWHDVVARYRRSWVGPIWLVLSMLIFVIALGLVYSLLFNIPVPEYLPFVAIGIVTWTFISSIATESVQTFVEAEGYIRQINRPLSIYVYRVIWRNVIVFSNQFVAALGVALVFNRLYISYLPLALIGLALLAAQAVWITLLIGIIGARFRDLVPIVQNIVLVMFFITPIMWPPSALKHNTWIADINPLYHMIELVRSPLLGTVPPYYSYLMVIGMALIGFLLALRIYGRFRSRVVYWL